MNFGRGQRSGSVGQELNPSVAVTSLQLPPRVADELFGKPQLVETLVDTFGYRSGTLKQYVPVNLGPDDAVFLPHFNQHRVEDGTGNNSPLLGVSGRICQWNIPTEHSANGGYMGSREYAVVDSDWGPGYLWAAAEKTLSERAKQPTPLANITGAFAIFMMQNDAPNPYAGNRYFSVPKDAHGDWRLVDVLSSIDAFPYDTYFDRTSADGEAEFHGFGSKRLADLEQQYIENRLGGKARAEKLLDEVIDFGGALLEALMDLESINLNSLEDILAEAGKHMSRAGREIVDDLLKYNGNNPFILRVPIRAYAALNALKVQRDATGKLSSARRRFNDAIATQRAHTHSELVQSLNHFRVAWVSNAVMGAAEQQQPFRFSTTLVGELDVYYARLLRLINTGGMAEACQQVASAYGQLQLDAGDTLLHIKSFDPKTSLLKTVDGLRGGNGEITDEIVYADKALTVDARHGSSRAQMVASLYAPRPLRVDGIASRFYSVVYKHGTLQQGREFLVVDLLKAPAILLQWIYKNGHFSKSLKDSLPPEVYLSNMLRANLGEQFNMVVTPNKAGKVVLEGIMMPGHGVQFVRTPTGAIETDPTKMIPAITVVKKQGGKVSRHDSSIRNQFVVGSIGGRNAEGSTPVAGTMLTRIQDGLVTQVRFSPDGPSDGAVSTTAMPYIHLAENFKDMVRTGEK